METIKRLQNRRKNAHFMLVDGMTKLTTHQVITCQSSVFHIAGLKWKMIIYPAGKDGTKNYLSFYVRIKDRASFVSGWNVKCSLKLSIISQTKPDKWHSSELTECVYDKDNAFQGKENFISKEVLTKPTKGYLLNDQVVFFAEIMDVEPSFHLTVPRRTMGTAEHFKVTENSRFTWKITRFSSFGRDKCHMSNEFVHGQRKWQLVMYPNGNAAGKGNSLSLYLRATDYVPSGPKAKTLAVFKLIVFDQIRRRPIKTNKMQKLIGNDQKNNLCGEAQFIPLEKLDDSSCGFVVNDEISMCVEFLLISTTEPI